MGVKNFVKQILVGRENRRYERELQSRKVSYEDWAAELERQSSERLKGITEGLREEYKGAAERPQDGQKDVSEGQNSDCGFVVVYVGKGALASEACAYIGKYFAEHPETQLVYGDEDVWDGIREGESISGGKRHMPWFKPDWSPDLLDSFFYFGSAVAMRQELFWRGLSVREGFDRHGKGKAGAVNERTAVAKADEDAALKAVTEDAAIYEAGDLAEYEEWVRICVMLAGGYQTGSCSIGHLQRILFHCMSAEEQEKFLQGRPYFEECMEEQIQEFRNHYGILEQERAGAGNSEQAASCRPVISVVIPSRDQPEILEKCVEGCVLAAGTVPFEIVIVDNGSSKENQDKIRDMIGRKSGQCPGGMTYFYEPQEFNFSRMCNQGAQQAKGEFLLFLNDDVELCLADSIEKMAVLAERGCTGAVGIKLYYPDSVRIQHAGITNLPMGPVHKLQFLEDDRSYYFGTNRGRRNVLAVTAACLMVEKDKYGEAGGFSEELKVAFNDVDFCFRLYELGYRNVCMNDLYGYHHESLSRGADESAEKLSRLLRERDKLYERHPGLEGVDPYYSPYLNREGLDTGIRPAYLTAGNMTQRVSEKMHVMPLAKYRQDNCLMVRVEDFRSKRAVGYGVVLGDNNACYDRWLLLWKIQETSKAEGSGSEASGALTGNRSSMDEASGALAGNRCSGNEAGGSAADAIIYAVKLAGQYRPDLEGNMPDQVNVALGGYDVEVGENAVPEGCYRLGMAVRNKVTGIRLLNWSNRVVNL